MSPSYSKTIEVSVSQKIELMPILELVAESEYDVSILLKFTGANRTIGSIVTSVSETDEHRFNVQIDWGITDKNGIRRAGGTQIYVKGSITEGMAIRQIYKDMIDETHVLDFHHVKELGVSSPPKIYSLKGAKFESWPLHEYSVTPEPTKIFKGRSGANKGAVELAVNFSRLQLEQVEKFSDKLKKLFESVDPDR